MISRAVVFEGPSKTSDTAETYQLINNFECPDLGDHDVLVKISTCVLSPINVKVLRQLKLLRATSNPVGKDISGVISDVGSQVTRFKMNDEVTGIIPIDSPCGGCAHFCVMSEYDLVIKPSNISHVDAAACIGDALKAYTALHYHAKIASGDTVLIGEGTTGFGILAIQLSQSWGVKVIATVTTDEELMFLKGRQPPLAQIIDLRSKKKNVVVVCLEETGNLGVDCVIDCGVNMQSDDFEDEIDEDIAKEPNRLLPSKHDVISCLAVAGRWITSQSDLQLDPPDSELLFLKNSSVQFLFEQSWTLSRAAQGKYMHILQDIMDKMRKGSLRPMVHHTVMLEDCVEAFKQAGENNIGRVVVKVS